MDSVQIILIEILLVLVTGIGFLFFKAQKKKAAMRSQLATLLKKVTAAEPERKAMLITQFKALGAEEEQAEERAAQLLDSEKVCLRNFISFQLTQKENDISSFHDGLYGLSVVYFAVNAQAGVAEAVQESAAQEEPETTIEEKEIEADNSAADDVVEMPPKIDEEVASDEPEAGEETEKDEIDVSLDIDDIDESVNSIPEPEPELEPPKPSIIEEKNESFDIGDIVNEALSEAESGSKKPDDV